MNLQIISSLDDDDICVCVEPDLDSRCLHLPHTVCYKAACVCLLLALQVSFVYQCVTSMYVLISMACVFVCVLRRTCTAHGLALHLLHQRNPESSKIRPCHPLHLLLAGSVKGKETQNVHY